MNFKRNNNLSLSEKKLSPEINELLYMAIFVNTLCYIS